MNTSYISQQASSLQINFGSHSNLLGTFHMGSKGHHQQQQQKQIRKIFMGW